MAKKLKTYVVAIRFTVKADADEKALKAAWRDEAELAADNAEIQGKVRKVEVVEIDS